MVTGPKDRSVQHIGASSSFDFRSDEYADLFARSGATAFQHPLWLDRLCTLLAPNRGAEPVVVTGRTGDGGLAFVLPMTLRSVSGVRLLEAADLGVSDYCAPVVDEGLTSTLEGGANIRPAVTACLPAHDVLRIRNTRQEHVSAWNLFFDQEFTRLDFSAHETRLASDYEEWRDRALSKSFAKYLRRKKNGLDKVGSHAVEHLRQPDEIGEAIDLIARLRAGRFAGDMIQDDHVREFYRGIAVDGAAAGLARTYRLSVEGEAAGYVFGLTWNGRFHYLLIGCDYERFGKYSPGLVMYDAIIADWIADGGEIFDFTIGDEKFKADFGTSVMPISGVEHASGLAGRIALLAREAKSWLARPGKAA